MTSLCHAFIVQAAMSNLQPAGYSRVSAQHARDFGNAMFWCAARPENQDGHIVQLNGTQQPSKKQNLIVDDIWLASSAGPHAQRAHGAIAIDSVHRAASLSLFSPASGRSGQSMEWHGMCLRPRMMSGGAHATSGSYYRRSNVLDRISCHV
jgi:hypothetical protein